MKKDEITVERAIEEINNMRKYNYILAPLQVFDMAISALKGFEGMTNGEVIKALFPKCVISIDDDGWFTTNIDGYSEFTPEWWNAPYKKGE